MANVLNTLYPPTISTFLPAFVNTTTVFIYFSLSPYNSSSQIARVHVSLTNQLNNESALNNVNGIIFKPLRYDDVSGLYYVTISPEEVKNNSFNINQFYKVQLRFDGYSGENSSLINGTAAQVTQYLSQYQDYFSEWSSVCLIKAILQPDIQLKPFDLYNGDTPQSFNKGIIAVSGKLFFGDGSVTETETLQSFKIQILDLDTEDVLLESPTVYTGDNVDPNDINYRIDLQGLDTETKTEFIFKITISTKNQYITSKQWEFQIADFLDDYSFDPELTVEMDNEEGIATLHVVNVQTVFGTIYIKRGSSIDNFENWEDFYVEKIAGDIDLTLEDNTVSSLVWYRYSIQMENSVGGMTRVYRSDIFMPEFYDAVISRGKQQFKIQYNYSITSFKPVVNRTKVDTLGGKFPKFAENAILNYKQFSISGLISSEADVHQKFLNKRDYFDDNYQRYQVYKSDTGVKDLVRNDYDDYLTESEILTSYLTTTQNDWLWEREFREEAMKWLNDGEPKLYRSMTEGNMVVMLTDITLTPNSTLSRRLWTFTATVYEIAEADSLETLDSLGIFEIVRPDELTGGGSGEIDPDPEYVEVIKVGQLYNYTVTHNNSIISELLDELKREYGAIPGGENNELVYDSASVLADKLPDGLYLKNIKIFFNNKPNVYYTDEYGNLILIRNPGTSSYNKDRMSLGYTFDITTDTNDTRQTIFVNSKGYDQVPDKLNVTALYFNNVGEVDTGGRKPYPADNVTVEYLMVYKELNNTSTIISGQTVDRTVIGQYEGVFEYGEDLGEKIRAKYLFTQTGQYYQQMQYWRGICLDVEPYAIAYIQYYRDDDYNDYVVGGTGVLHMIKNVPVQDMYFAGRRMTPKPLSRQDFLDDWEYVIDEGPQTGGDNLAYWNEDRNRPVYINFDRLNKEYEREWSVVTDTIEEMSNASQGYNSIKDISNPKRNTVYNINGSLKIYYKDDWYDFTQYNDYGIAHVPIEGMINYLGNVIQSTYA